MRMASTGGVSAVMRRSARRHTVRATCSEAPAGVPPARMNRRRGVSSPSKRSISASSRSTSPLPRTVFETRAATASDRIGQLRAEREQVALNVDERNVDVLVETRRAHEPEPRVELVDFTVRVDARIVLGHARAAKERRFAAVAGSRVDFHVGEIIRDG